MSLIVLTLSLEGMWEIVLLCHPRHPYSLPLRAGHLPSCAYQQLGSTLWNSPLLLFFSAMLCARSVYPRVKEATSSRFHLLNLCAFVSFLSFLTQTCMLLFHL